MKIICMCTLYVCMRNNAYGAWMGAVRWVSSLANLQLFDFLNLKLIRI